MKSRLAVFAILALAGLLLTGRTANTEGAAPDPVSQQTIRYDYEYKCGGETIVIDYCRRDSDQPGMPATRPLDDYCQIYYPDRPKRNGFTAMGTGLYGDLVKQLQACGALDGRQPADRRTTESSGSGADTVMDMWQRTISKTPLFLGKDDVAIVFISPTECQLYCKGASVTRPYTVEQRNGQTVLTLASLWTFFLQYDGSLLSSSKVKTVRMTSQSSECTVDVLFPRARSAKNAASPAAGTAKTAQPIADTGPGAKAAETYYQQAKKHVEAKDYPKAIESFKKAISVQPSYAAYNQLGLAYYYSKQYPDAVVAFQQAIRLEPDFAAAHINLGLTYSDFKQHQKAVSSFKEALRLKPDHAFASHHLGIAYYNLKQYPEALASFTQAIRLKFENPEWDYGWIGMIHSALEDYGSAISAFQEALRLKPDYADAAFQLGFAYFMSFEIENARRSYELAVRLKPDDATYHYQLGSTYFSPGLYPIAVREFQEAIRLKPDYAQAYSFLGSTYIAMGRKDLALQVYKTLSSIDKDLAQKLLDEINKPAAVQPTDKSNANAPANGRRSRPVRGTSPVQPPQ